MLTITRKTRTAFSLLLIFTLVLTLFTSVAWVSATETAKPKPQPWQIDGIVAALDDSQDKVKENAFRQLAIYEPQDLKAVLKKPEDIAHKAADILKDKKVDASVRGSAAVALGNIRKLELNEVVVVLNNVYEPDKQEIQAGWRFLTYFLGGGTDEVKTLLKWVGNPKELPTQLEYAEAEKTLKVFHEAWTASQELENLQKDLAGKIADVTYRGSWRLQNIDLLKKH